MDEKSLREIFTSIGVANKNGDFLIKALIDKNKAIDDYNLLEGESIKKVKKAYRLTKSNPPKKAKKCGVFNLCR